MTNAWTDNLMNGWAQEGVRLCPPASVDEVAATEQILGFQFPLDFKAFYLRLNGFANWDMTSNMFTIWPLERIVEEYNRESDKSFIVFADWLINSHHIGFVKGKNGVFKMYDMSPVFIAGSFSEVVSLINEDADVLY